MWTCVNSRLEKLEHRVQGGQGHKTLGPENIWSWEHEAIEICVCRNIVLWK